MLVGWCKALLNGKARHYSTAQYYYLNTATSVVLRLAEEKSTCINELNVSRPKELRSLLIVQMAPITFTAFAPIEIGLDVDSMLWVKVDCWKSDLAGILEIRVHAGTYFPSLS